MTTISDLSPELIEEILSRVPLITHRAVRSTCKQWNALSKDNSFTKKYRVKAAKDPMVIMVCDFRVCLMRVNLQDVDNHKNGLGELFRDPELFITQIGSLNRIELLDVHHCDGLLLFLPKYGTVKSVLVVCNPYLGHVRWIQTRQGLCVFDKYCLGYDNKNNNHKILRFADLYQCGIFEYEIYDFESSSWRVLDVTPNWSIPYCRQGLSLKGNTYFVAHERLSVEEEEMREYLLCFDYTRERFGPLLDLQFNSRTGDSVILSAVREDQLALLFYSVDTYEMEIRITTKIEADAVSWSNFLKVYMKPFTGMLWTFPPFGSFLVDEKKKVSVIYGNDKGMVVDNKAYVIGEKNYFRKVDGGDTTGWPSLCYYAPSSVHIQQGRAEPAVGKRKVRDY